MINKLNFHSQITNTQVKFTSHKCKKLKITQNQKSRGSNFRINNRENNHQVIDQLMEYNSSMKSLVTSP